MAAWRHEKSLPHSDILERLKEKAAVATQVRREQRGSGQVNMSAFGKVHQRVAARAGRSAMFATALEDLGNRRQADHPTLATPPSEVRIVPVGNRGDGQFALVAGNSIPGQVQFIRRLRRYVAEQCRLKAEQEEAEVRAAVRQAPKVSGVDMSLVPMGSGSIGAMPGDLLTIMQVHDNLIQGVSEKVAAMPKEQAQLCEAALRYWSKEHFFTPEAEIPPVDEVPAWALPTLCHLHGEGTCICRGNGAVRLLAQKLLSRSITRHAPKGSVLRGLLLRRWIVLKIENHSLHVGLLYLRPKRPTLLRMSLRDQTAWGYQVLDPMYLEDGRPACVSVLGAMGVLALEGPLSVQMFRLVALKRPLNRWKPDRLLCIEPLAEPAEASGCIAFWKGAEHEMVAENKRSDKAAAAAFRKACKEATDKEPAPRAAPKTHPQRAMYPRAMPASSHPPSADADADKDPLLQTFGLDADMSSDDERG